MKRDAYLVALGLFWSQTKREALILPWFGPVTEADAVTKTLSNPFGNIQRTASYRSPIPLWVECRGVSEKGGFDPSPSALATAFCRCRVWHARYDIVPIYARLLGQG